MKWFHLSLVAAMLVFSGVVAQTQTPARPAPAAGQTAAPARPALPTLAAPIAQPGSGVPAQATSPLGGRTYVGSQVCAGCHRATYERWSKTRMANVVTDPKLHPEVVSGDFANRTPAVNFTLDQVALVYGTKWKQRYFTKVGDDYFPLGAQWDVVNKQWRPYLVANGTDWWVPHYGPTNADRPTGPLCDGCHSVNYNIATKTPTEWNVGCEKCHGPGSAHVRNPSAATIVNPARLDFVQANDTCIQCHSQGQPLNSPIQGAAGQARYYDWPVGFHQGEKLQDFWKLEEHKLGEQSFTHFADGTAHKNRMQGNDFVQSVMYRRGVTCFSCHDVHGTNNPADLLKPTAQICLTCHGPTSPNGPHTATLEAHTHHAAGTPGSDCVSCHMPKIEQTIANVNVRSHTFAFIPPATTDALKVPNACTDCHKDKNTAWATAALRTWANVSPWRMEP